MSKNILGIVLILVSMASPAGTNVARAADEPSSAEEKVLKDKGLNKNDRHFLLEEAAAIEKYEQSKSLYTDYQKALSRSAEIAQYDEAVQSMEAEQQALQQQVSALQMQINHSGAGYGRMQRYVNAQLAPLRQQENQARAMINQLNIQIKAAKGKAPKADERKSAPARVEQTRQAYIDSIRELNELVTPLVAKYHELAQDKTVTDALDALRHRTTRNYKLGPSDELVAASKMIENVKKHTTVLKAASKKKAKSKATAP